MLGANLAHARRLAGYSQLDVMRIIWQETGNQKNRISEIESGKSLPDAELLSDLCRLYSVSADYICGFSAEPEIDQTAGRVGMIYTGLTEIATSATQQMIESLSRLSANYIAVMPKPHTMALLDAAKTVRQKFIEEDRDKIQQQYPALSQSLFEMFKIAQEFDRSQAINLTGYETALDEVLQQHSDDPRHYLTSADAIPRQKRYPCVSLPRKDSTGQRQRRSKPDNQIALSWPDTVGENGE
ncbi:MAG: helix-turn-helix transcriptional regulator [Pseudomonadota bacterium]|nr:helix-turn-helix transcriptional regulator [Pseudomonadota bacterium]